MLHIKLKGITMQQHGSNYFVCRRPYPRPPPPPLTLKMGSKGQNQFFSKHGHVTYQIKCNHEMEQHGSKYFTRNPHPLTLGVKIHFFQKNFMLHIKLKGITMQQHGRKYFACRPPRILTLELRSKLNFIRIRSSCKSN